MVTKIGTGVLKEAINKTNKGVMEDAPAWYDTPLEELDFEWSPEEKLEIERYCEKIHKNIAQDEMTPYQRLQALVKGEPKDRQFVQLMGGTQLVTRPLDWGGDIIKPVDLCRTPKLWVKAHLYSLARLGYDNMLLHPLSYTEEMWGGRAKMIEMSQPVQIKAPIKTMEDLEHTQVPDPKRDGLFPGILWSDREMRRIFDEYGLTGVVPILAGLGAGIDAVVSLGMTGIGGFMILLRKDPEVCKRATSLAKEWNKRFAHALHELCRPDWWQMCEFTGSFSLRANEWLADIYIEMADFLKGLAPQRQLHFGLSTFDLYYEWMDLLQEKGAVGPDRFDGGLTGNEPWEKLKKMIDYHREHNLYLTAAAPDEIMSKGPISAIEDMMKELCEYSKSSPKYSPSIMSDFWAPTAYWEAGIEAVKKYGKY